ncbi:hypothetical protein, partial [Sinorhizobium meliloti]|uniref:hypothetical protein n=1 Tax=Rhizobium meliloti TaxID=382 RepID=UPI001AECFE5E
LFVTHIWCPPILSGHFMRQRHQREKAHGNERLRFVGGSTHDRSRRSNAAATSDLFQNTLPQWCCIARHFEGQESFQEVIMGFWAP